MATTPNPVTKPCGIDSKFFKPVTEIKGLPSTLFDVKGLTETSLVGEGILDILLRTLGVWLQKEYDSERLQGKEYATVFNDLYSTNLQAAIQVYLAKESQSLELELLQAKIAHEKEATLLTQAQKCKVNKEAELLGWQIEIAKAEIEIKLIQLEIEKEKLAIARIELQVKMKQLELLQQQIEIERAKLGLIKWQIETERANTDPTNVAPESLVGKQIAVLTAQIAGYKRDAEQKAANMLINTWISRLNNDSALINDANILHDYSIGLSVESLLKGVGITEVTAVNNSSNNNGNPDFMLRNIRKDNLPGGNHTINVNAALVDTGGVVDWNTLVISGSTNGGPLHPGVQVLSVLGGEFKILPNSSNIEFTPVTLVPGTNIGVINIEVSDVNGTKKAGCKIELHYA